MAEVLSHPRLHRPRLVLEPLTPAQLDPVHALWTEPGVRFKALPAIGAATDLPNLGSVRLLDRLGMRLVDRRMFHGLDTLFYHLPRTEWAARSRAEPG